jgi:hypothetical protein
MSKTNDLWQPIKKFKGKDHAKVDLWLDIYPSPRSFGWGDSFRVIDAWREKGKWFHYHEGKPTEIYNDYITHYMLTPEPPKDRA